MTDSADVVERFVGARRIAVVGASRNDSSITVRPAVYLRRYGFGGEVVLVHPSAAELHGLRAYRSLAEIDGPVDLVMSMVQGDAVRPVVRECIDLGIPAVISVASGFEGSGGQERRRSLAALVADHPGTRLVGPNSVGVLSTVTRSWTTFSSVLLDGPPAPGNIGLVTQSGAVGNGILMTLQARGVGVGHWFSTGDELDVGALEVATALVHRADCKVVGLFLEGITDPGFRRPLAEAIRATGKRVVAIRSASSGSGKAAALGHTGRVVGDSEIGLAGLREIGVEIVDSVDELVETLTFLSVAPPRPPSDAPARVTVVTVSGAMGVVAADHIARHPSLALASLDEQVTAELARLVPSYSGDEPANPLDVPVLGDPAVFEQVVKVVTGSDGGDATMIVTTTLAHDYESISRHLHSDRPVALTHLSAAESFTPEQARRLTEQGVAVLRSPYTAVRALAVWSGAGPDVPAAEPDPGHDDHDGAAARQLGVVASGDVLGGVLSGWMPPVRVVADEADAVAFLAEAGGPVVVKAEGSAIAHRTELGAVAVGLTDEAAVREAYRRISAICAAGGDRVVAQAMSRPGTEVLVSVVRDPELGTVALCRLGGVQVELGSSATLVLTDYDEGWVGALRESAVGKVLAGWRGEEPGDAEALLQFVREVRERGEHVPGLRLAEFNPVLVHAAGQGVTAVDVVTYLDPSEGAQ
ncbi:acetate--CoA ligase family protein [Pseudonocardia ailaonensis]